jgi:hypothetical protein
MKKKKIEPIVEDEKFSNADALEILRLFKVAVATSDDLESIFKLYKRYINPGASTYSINCNCSISISRFYQELLDWYSQNANQFR